MFSLRYFAERFFPGRYFTHATPDAPVPVPPTILTSGSLSVAENSTSVIALAATGDTPITWSISGGDDQLLFAVGSLSGLLTFQSAPDFEAPADTDTDNVYLVEVTATNDAGTDSLLIGVTVTDVDETVPPPTPSGPSGGGGGGGLINYRYPRRWREDEERQEQLQRQIADDDEVVLACIMAYAEGALWDD